MTRKRLLVLMLPLGVLLVATVGVLIYRLPTTSQRQASGVVEDVNDLLASYHRCPSHRRAMVMPPSFRNQFPGAQDGKTLNIVFKDEDEMISVAKQLDGDIDELRRRIGRLLPLLERRDRAPLIAAEFCLADLEVRVACQHWTSTRNLGTTNQDSLLAPRRWPRLRSRMQETRLSWSECVGEQTHWASRLGKTLEWYVVNRERAARANGMALYGGSWANGFGANTPALPESLDCFGQLLVRRLDRLSSMQGDKQGTRQPLLVDEEEVFTRVGLWGVYRISKQPPEEMGAMARGILVMGNTFAKLEFGIIDLEWCRAPANPGRRR